MKIYIKNIFKYNFFLKIILIFFILIFFKYFLNYIMYIHL